MGRPQTVTDQEIATAARAVFLEMGARAPAELVAQRLGVSAAALFKRMKTKEALIIAALCGEREPAFVATLRQGPREGIDIRRQLQSIAHDALVTFRGVVPVLFVLRSSGIPLGRAFPGGPPPPVILRDELSRFLARAVRARMLAAHKCAVVADVMLSAIEARCFMEYVTVAGPVADSDAAPARPRDRAYCADLVEALTAGLAVAKTELKRRRRR